MNCAVLIHPGRPVKDVDGNGIGYPNNLRLLAMNGSGYFLAVPFGLTSQKVSCQIDGVLDTDAARAETARVVVKELSVRRVVQIDVELVGKHEFHLAQCVFRPWPLPQREWKI